MTRLDDESDDLLYDWQGVGRGGPGRRWHVVVHRIWTRDLQGSRFSEVILVFFPNRIKKITRNVAFKCKHFPNFFVKEFYEQVVVVHIWVENWGVICNFSYNIYSTFVSALSTSGYKLLVEDIEGRRPLQATQEEQLSFTGREVRVSNSVSHRQYSNFRNVVNLH